MKKTFKALKLSCIFLLTSYSFIACDKEYSIIESDVLGEGNSNFTTANIEIPLIAYNKKIETVQINGLASAQLGFFNDIAFGTTTSSIVTQVIPSLDDPDFGNNTVIDSVVLKIPYYSTLTGDLDNNDYPAYSIDSLYGSSPIKLSIYQNNYFLRDFDPNLGIGYSQMYYSNAENTASNTENFAVTDNSNINFDNHKGALIYEEDEFTPSSENIILTTLDDEGLVDSSTLLNPALRVHLDNTYWQSLIVDKEGEDVLSNENNFKNYFRGLYFKTESIGGDGNMVLLDLASTDANIIIYYSHNTTLDDDTTKTQSSYTMNFSGNTLNTFINDYNIETLADGDNISGDEKLYLKGTAGSMAVVDLFENEDLEDFRNEFSYIDTDGERKPTRLINEAILVVYEDDNLTIPSDEEDYHTYDRLYAYDINNNITLIDYSFDSTDNTATPFNSKYVHLGQRDTIGDGMGYKIRITEHIKNIILNDSTNTKLGLVLSNNVNYTNIAEILNSNDDVSHIPAASIITPRGTILYGSNHGDDDRKMKLELYYTEPKD